MSLPWGMSASGAGPAGSWLMVVFAVASAVLPAGDVISAGAGARAARALPADVLPAAGKPSAEPSSEGSSGVPAVPAFGACGPTCVCLLRLVHSSTC